MNPPHTGPKELESILEFQSAPTVNPIFGPTASLFYWSASTFSDDPSLAWFVDFTDGGVGDDGKSNYNYVRAVRGAP